MVLVQGFIPYPIAVSNIIYIGKSEDNMARRLRSHIRGDNYGLQQFIENKECAYHFLDPHGNKDVNMLEIKLIKKFQDVYGRMPICNNKVG